MGDVMSEGYCRVEKTDWIEFENIIDTERRIGRLGHTGKN